MTAAVPSTAGNPPRRPPTGNVLHTSTGRVLDVLADLPGGRSHTTRLVRDTATGEHLVIKSGGDPERLHHEALVLAELAPLNFLPGPRLRAACHIRSTPSGAPEPCLLLEHIPSRPPQSPADLHAFGIALAAWHTAPTASLWTLHRTPEYLLRPARAFAAAHAPRLTALLDRLVPPEQHHWSRVVLTHGDATPSNALIRPDGRAVLVDCETTALAHPGIDVGRALLAVGLTSTAAQCRPHIDALLAGYTTAHRPCPDLAAWTAAAGLHIAAWRHLHQHRPETPPWQEALAAAHQWAAVRDA